MADFATVKVRGRDLRVGTGRTCLVQRDLPTVQWLVQEIREDLTDALPKKAKEPVEHTAVDKVAFETSKTVPNVWWTPSRSAFLAVHHKQSAAEAGPLKQSRSISVRQAAMRGVRGIRADREIARQLARATHWANHGELTPCTPLPKRKRRRKLSSTSPSDGGGMTLSPAAVGGNYPRQSDDAASVTPVSDSCVHSDARACA